MIVGENNGEFGESTDSLSFLPQIYETFNIRVLFVGHSLPQII